VTEDQAPDSILEFTGGDVTAARTLRESLTELAARHDGTPLGREIDDVLAGRAGFRSLADDPVFSAIALEGARAFEQAWMSLDPEEKARLVHEAQRDEEPK
jgi:hypothetical protein